MKHIRFSRILFLSALFVLLLSVSALADWQRTTENGSTVWHYYVDGEIVTDDWAPEWGYTCWMDENGTAVRSCWKEIEGCTYYFNSSAHRVTGWQRLTRSGSTHWFYFDSQGRMVANDWAPEWGYTCWMDENGKAVRSCWKEINGSTYYFNSSAHRVTGWQKLTRSGSTHWFYFDSQGRMISDDWAPEGYYTCWMDENGKAIRSCWKEINGCTYYFNSSAHRVTGWHELTRDGVTGWYCFDTYGRMRTGWQDLGGERYYFYTGDDGYGQPVGSQAYSTVIDGVTLKSSGAAVLAPEIYMNNEAQYYTSATPYLILVDTTNCRVGVYYGSWGNWSQLFYWQCSPGAASTPTVTGIFSVGSKGYSFTSYGSVCYYYTQFYGNYLFHTVPCNADGSVQDSRLGVNISHGCVRLSNSAAYWIYKNVPTGTTVSIYA